LASRGRTGDWSSYRGNHLGQRSRTASTGRTYGCKRSDQTLKKLLWPGGRPHMGPGARPGRRDRIFRIHQTTTRLRHTSAFSQQHSPEFCKFIRPRKREGAARPSREGAVRSQEGRREDRVRAAPAVSCAKAANKNAHEHTGSAETLRPSLRNGCTAYSVLSPARPELVCHRRSQEA
jgi:hypothetical protein